MWELATSVEKQMDRLRDGRCMVYWRIRIARWMLLSRAWSEMPNGKGVAWAGEEFDAMSEFS